MATEHQNKEAWNTGAYQAWVNRFGTPDEAARKLKEDPIKRIGMIYKYLGQDVKGKKVINLLGSNGQKAVALALLGAQATVVDFSAENEQYAIELAAAAQVNIRYILADVLQMPAAELNHDNDIVLMENGILHYFQDLRPLFRVVAELLRCGGRLVLQDFHPITTKLITSKGTTAKIRKHKVTGDYFATALEEKEVSFSKFLSPEQRQQEHSTHRVYLRHWTLGEIVTAVAGAGLCMKVLEELPNLSSDVFDKGIPKTFTLVAERL